MLLKSWPSPSAVNQEQWEVVKKKGDCEGRLVLSSNTFILARGLSHLDLPQTKYDALKLYH